MTHQPDSRPQPVTVADLAATPDSVSVPALWAALPPDDRRRALALAIREDRALRPVLVSLLQKTPRYRAFRAVSFASWSPEQFADALKTSSLLSPDVMQAALIALHVGDRSAMLGAFLDKLGIPHQNGVIGEMPEAFSPGADELGRAADDLVARFPRDQVTLYLLTLLVLEPELWGGLAEWLGRQPAAG